MVNIYGNVDMYEKFVEVVRQKTREVDENVEQIISNKELSENNVSFSDDVMEYALELLETDWISDKQYDMACRINNLLVRISELRAGQKGKVTLSEAAQFLECRELGKRLLSSLSY